MGRRKKPFIVESVTITGIADKGRAVGRDAEGRVFFVEGAVPGDVVDILAYRRKKGIYLSRLERVVQASPNRLEPFCGHFGVCGGCKWQHLDYASQLAHKQENVESAMRRIGHLDIEQIDPILGGEEISYYRNKMEFGCSSKRFLTDEELKSDISNVQDVIGFHRAGVYDKIIDIEHCHLQYGPSNEIRNGIRELAKEMDIPFFDMRERYGLLRQLMLRTTSLDQNMVVIVFFENDQERIIPFLEKVQELFPQITSLFYCINPKLNEFLMDLDMHHFAGQQHIEEQLGEVLFRIGPKSFFQTNTRQAKRLFDTVVDFAQFTGEENVYDLYTGLGSIGLYIAKHCKQVVGIEEIPAAIEDAKVNAELNNITNAIFYAGDVKNILTTAFAEKHGKPDLLITDPPRAGMHPKVVEMLIQLASPRIVYVSCNPATQARDLALMSDHYHINRIRPVDMFPHTSHVENVALLTIKS